MAPGEEFFFAPGESVYVPTCGCGGNCVPPFWLVEGLDADRPIWLKLLDTKTFKTPEIVCNIRPIAQPYLLIIGDDDLIIDEEENKKLYLPHIPTLTTA